MNITIMALFLSVAFATALYWREISATVSAICIVSLAATLSMIGTGLARFNNGENQRTNANQPQKTAPKFDLFDWTAAPVIAVAYVICWLDHQRSAASPGS